MIKTSRPLLEGISLRPRLFEQLDILRRAPAIWLSANAGAGKTSLISSYIETRHIPCLWYQLDTDETDIGGFFYYLGRAAAQSAAKECPSLPLFMPEYLQGVPAFSRRYFESLYACFEPPFLLVFDNYQEVPPDSALHEIVNLALQCLPEGMNAIIISRCEPPALFVRQQANRNLAMLRWDDLRFTEQEALAIFGQGDQKRLPPETLQHLYRLADGWAAGLMLMAQLAQSEGFDMQDSISNSQEQIFAYFAHEVFAALNAPTREFLVKTAHLPQMTAQMATELTAHPDAASMLQAFVRNNFFTVRHAKAIYAYHRLFRDFLLARAPKVLPPEILPSLQRHAADLLAQTDQLEAALDLLRNLADWQRIATIVQEHAPVMLRQGRHRSLLEWFGLLPDAILETSPWLLYWKGMSALSQEPREARVCFERAFLIFQTDQHPIGAVLAASGVTNAIVIGYEDFTPLAHWFAVLNDLVKSVQPFPNDETEAWVTASMVTALGILETPHPDADAWVKRALTLKETPSTINPKIHALYQLFWHQGVNRGMNGLFPMLQEMQRLACSFAATPHARLIVHIATTQYYEETGMHPECLQAVEEALTFAESHGIHLYDLTINCMAVASYLNRMESKPALERIEHLQPSLAEAKPWDGSSLHHQFTRAALIDNALEQALYHAEQAFRFGSSLGSPFIEGCVHWMLAQVLHRLDRKQEALDHLGQCFAIAEQAGTGWIAVMTHLIDAQFAFDQGDEQHGLQSLRTSLEMARQGGYLFTCYDDPAVTVRMCMKALEADIEVAHVQKIIRTRGLIPATPPVHLENWPWPIKVYTLGRFSIVRDGIPLQSGKKAQQMPLRLLKSLIALGGRDIAEERISNLLWRDAEGDTAHHAFETTLLRLRKLLGYPEALRFRAGKLSLDPRYCWVDIWVFERLAGQAEAFHAQDKTPEADQVTKTALKLYQGAFLGREQEEPWILAPTERFKAKAFNTTIRMAAALEAKGQHNAAIPYYEQCLNIEPCSETAYQQLMLCHHRLNKKCEALAVYQRCRTMLNASLGINPSAETETIRTILLTEG